MYSMGLAPKGPDGSSPLAMAAQAIHANGPRQATKTTGLAALLMASARVIKGL